MTAFKDYNDIVVKAYECHPKQQEIIDRKKEIIDRLAEYYNFDFKTILFVGFNPAIYSIKNAKLFLTEVNNNAVYKLKNDGIDFEVVENPNRQFDLVVSGDEFLTFAASEDEQRLKIQTLCKLTGSCLMTTVRDYKNLDFKVREFSEPAIIRNNNDMDIFSEIHSWDIKDRYSFTTYNYHSTENSSEFLGKFDRRTLFFKQLAKITSDAGSTNFVVHKNLMYKSLIKKNYEHVITIDFN